MGDGGCDGGDGGGGAGTDGVVDDETSGEAIRVTGASFLISSSQGAGKHHPTSPHSFYYNRIHGYSIVQTSRRFSLSLFLLLPKTYIPSFSNVLQGPIDI
jgi:hypothetical protein